MQRTRVLVMGGVLAALGIRSDVAEARGSAEDDLAVVRRAVAQNTPATTTPPPVEDKARARKASPQWLRVRITERGGKSKVSVNLPLALARSIGEDIPLHWGCRRHCDGDRASLRLGDVLRSLDSGQDIVQVDSDEGTVRVWVE